MAKAVRPGVGKREAAKAEAAKVLTLRFRGEEHKLAMNLVPLREKMALVRQADVDWEELLFRPHHYATTLAPFVWLARRANGEPDLTFAEFCDEWPTDITLNEIELDVAEPDEGDSHPEA